MPRFERGAQDLEIVVQVGYGYIFYPLTVELIMVII